MEFSFKLKTGKIFKDIQYTWMISFKWLSKFLPHLYKTSYTSTLFINEYNEN